MMHTLILFCADKQCEVDLNCVYIIIQTVFITRCFSLQSELPFVTVVAATAKLCNM